MKIVLLFALISIGIGTFAAQTSDSPPVAPKKCGPNEYFDKCGPSCPETCESKLQGPPQPCVQMCSLGCFCNLGFVRKTPEGECIPTGECWPKSNPARKL